MPATRSILVGVSRFLKIMRLVDEDVIDAQLVEHQPVILLVLGQQVFQPFLAGGLLLLDGLDDVAAAAAGVGAGAVAEQLLVFLDLLAQELLLVVAATCRSARSSCG